MGIDVDWSTDPKAPGIVTVEDGLVMAETKGSTTIHATNTLRQIRGSLKVTVQKAVDKVVVYDGYADDGDSDEEYATRLRGAEDKGTFSTEVKGSKHRAYAIAYDDEDDMLNDITFEWASSSDNATIKAVKAVAAPKALKTDGSESRSNPGNFKVQITVNGSAKIMATAMPGDVESEEVSVNAFTPVSTVRHLEVDQTDLPVEFTYAATLADEVSVTYYRIVPATTGTPGADDEVREFVEGNVTFSEVGGAGLLTFYDTGGDTNARMEGGTVSSDTGGQATLNFVGTAADGTVPTVTANSITAVVKEVPATMNNVVTYVQVSAGFAGSQVIKVTINPKP